jgi:hypothetical protein
MANWAAESWARGGQECVRAVSACSHLRPKTGSRMGARGRPRGPGSGWVGPLGAGFSACLSGRTDTDPRCPFGPARWRCPKDGNEQGMCRVQQYHTHAHIVDGYKILPVCMPMGINLNLYPYPAGYPYLLGPQRVDQILHKLLAILLLSIILWRLECGISIYLLWEDM